MLFRSVECDAGARLIHPIQQLLGDGLARLLPSNGDIPIFLKSFLSRHPNIKTIVFHLDNDEVGTSAATYMMNRLKNKYHCIDQHPTKYKDVNEELQEMKKV